ncbi:MAG TPA: cytochrome c, partial [Thermoanaerobaculia bacterium]|nr:cytochrome c [Thermoanaerobaculia bacterium]
MGKRILKFLAWTAATIAALALVVVTIVLIRANRRFDAPYPDVHASKDAKVIARGAEIAYGAGHCVNCHTNDSESASVKAGGTPLLAGGQLFALPLGNIWTPNLTPDRQTGIGRYTDVQLARVLRYGVMPDGRAALPFMEYHNLSDDDLTALISFLRSQKRVRRNVPEHEFTFAGKAVMAFLIKPIGPRGTPPRHTPAEEPTVERGEYIATSVAVCAECHTKRNRIDGSFVGQRFAGGLEFETDDPDRIIVSPNLTPSKSGRITSWTEEQFVGRFGAGVGIPHTHMPWRQFQRM